MSRNPWNSMLMYPPELSDESVQAVWEYLDEICRSFERHYATQLKRRLDAEEGIVGGGRPFDEKEDDPF